MLRTVFIMANGMVAAMDEQGQQVPDAQGEIVDFYYQFMREKGLADARTVFNHGMGGLHQVSGEELDRTWRRQEEEPT